MATKKTTAKQYESVLIEANELVNGDRAKAYGSVHNNFNRWAQLCRATGRRSMEDITVDDLAIIMVMGKLARETNSHKRDNVTDACGYLDLYQQLKEAPDREV